jgi:hypothetical protein
MGPTLSRPHVLPRAGEREQDLRRIAYILPGQRPDWGADGFCESVATAASPDHFLRTGSAGEVDNPSGMKQTMIKCGPL